MISDYFDALARPLREQIHAGGLPVGALLPSESVLARAASTTRYSIRKALGLLYEEGLIRPMSGRGWIVVDPTTGATSLPLYRRIADELAEQIKSGLLSVGSALPSEAELVARHGVSRATVREALAVLGAEGLISTRPGKGRYVRPR